MDQSPEDSFKFPTSHVHHSSHYSWAAFEKIAFDWHAWSFHWNRTGKAAVNLTFRENVQQNALDYRSSCTERAFSLWFVELPLFSYHPNIRGSLSCPGHTFCGGKARKRGRVGWLSGESIIRRQTTHT